MPNTGTVVSSVAHVAVLAYAVVGFSSAKPYEPTMESVAVEVLTPSEFDALTKGDRNSKKVADTPKVAAKKVEPVEAEPKPALPEKKENVEATQPPPEPKPPEPAPPEPKKAEAPPPPPEPKPEPKPEPPKQAEAPPPPEPKPAPKQAEAPKPPEKKPEPKKEDPIQKVLDRKPEPKKPERKPEKPQPKFDPTKIASLIDKRDPGRTPQAAAQASDVTTAGVSRGTASQLQLTRSSMLGNMIREQLYNCWNPPVGTEGMRDLMATIEFNLTQQGVLVGQPRLQSSSSNPAFQAFADSAMRAVHSCTQTSRPLRLPPEDYNLWQNVTLDFILPET